MKETAERFEIPQSEIESLARCLLPDILLFFASEEGQKEFEAWKECKDTRHMTKT